MHVFGFNNALTGEVNKTTVSADPNPLMKEVTVEPMVWVFKQLILSKCKYVQVFK